MASKTLLVKDIGMLGTLDPVIGDVPAGAIFVKDNVIQWVGPTNELPKEYASADVVLSLPERVVIPGLVNTHHHMFQALTRCIAQESRLYEWLRTLIPVWSCITPEDSYTSAKLAMAELILSGCTTTSDHQYMFPNGVKLDDAIRAGKEIGIRFHPCRGSITDSKKDGGMVPEYAAEKDLDAVIAEMTRLIETYHDPEPYSMLRIGLAPCAKKNTAKELYIRSAQLANKYPAVRLHTHMAETDNDIEYCMKKYGCRPGEFLRQVGWDTDRVWLAHCVCINEEEQDMFKECSIGVAHCPSANTRLASGICAVREMVGKGVNVGLGVDGSASNDSSNLLGEARLAFLLQRAGGNPKKFSPREALRVAVQGGAKNLGRDDIGRIAPGLAADFAAWSTDGVEFAGAQHDLVSALLLCMPARVDVSVINGKVLVSDGKFVDLDLKQLVRQHNQCSKNLFERYLAQAPPDECTTWQDLIISKH